MAVVSFTLTDDGVAAFQNALACILKFSENVFLDARQDTLMLSALNDTNSAFVAFTFSSAHFFRYRYEGSDQSPDKFFCSLLIRALLSIFRSRAGGDTSRSGVPDSSIERCDVSIEDGSNTRSRFVAKISWRNGITATHAIPFEARMPTIARFDESLVENQWSISAQTLRRLMDHFGPKVELLDINTEGSSVLNLACFTEKQYTKTDGILNMNLHTSVAVKMDDFDNIDVEDKHHIIINVKDFRAVLQHATTVSGNVTAQYSKPWSPLRFLYSENGLHCQFVLMTLGEKEDENSKKSKSRTRNSGETSSNFISRPPPSNTAPADVVTEVYGAEAGVSLPKGGQFSSRKSGSMPASGLPSGFETRPNALTSSTMRTEALYDDDGQWDPVNLEENNTGFVQIEWDESLQPELSFVPIRNEQDMLDNVPNMPPTELLGGMDPTQRLTQVRKYGLFD